MRSIAWAVSAATMMVAMAVSHPAAAKSLEGGEASVPCGDGQVVYSPTQLWPPNHKMRTITVTYIDSSTAGATQGDNDGDAESLTINSVTDNQVGDDDQGGHGCGTATQKQGSDWAFSTNTISGTDPATIATTLQVRGERCGKDKSEGRIYTINVTCGDGDSGTTSNPTTVDLNVTVPHDRGHAEKVN